MNQRCKCSIGGCIQCVCAKAGHSCAGNCSCLEEACTNREFQEARAVIMNNDALNAALGALAVNQQRLADTLTALAGRVMAAPVPAQPAVAPVVPLPAPIAVSMGSAVRYSGAKDESLTEWLEQINRKALEENWGDNEKRRAAASSLYGAAQTWNEEIGTPLANWTDWLVALRGVFETQLTQTQWQVLIEGRVQSPFESGVNYVMDKLKICRRSPAPLTEPQMVPYLIRGLLEPNHRAVMMVNSPATIAAFLTELRRLEGISNFVAVTPDSTATSSSMTGQEVLRAVESLTTTVGELSLQFSAMRQPVRSPTSVRHVTFERRPPGAGGEIRCYACQNYGHIARNCPTRTENSHAGSSGQGRL